jgi:hypothetical protein
VCRHGKNKCRTRCRSRRSPGLHPGTTVRKRESGELRVTGGPGRRWLWRNRGGGCLRLREPTAVASGARRETYRLQSGRERGRRGAVEWLGYRAEEDEVGP